jgi:hypothetical protein
MLAYSTIAVLVFALLIYLQVKKVKEPLAEDGNIGYIAFFAAIWPATMFIICCGFIYGISKQFK